MGTQPGDPLRWTSASASWRGWRAGRRPGDGASMQRTSPPPCAGASRTGSRAGRRRRPRSSSSSNPFTSTTWPSPARARAGSEPAWEHFVREFRPILLRIASRGQQADRARDVADSVYAELYGLDERDGARRSLFDYFHGRSSLAGWLKAVVAQRLVDKAGRRAGSSRCPTEEASLPEMSAGGRVRARARPASAFSDSCGSALADAIAGLEPRDQLRLSLYYAQDMTLAAIGRVLGESEATSSRKLERTRGALRAAVEKRLREVDRLTDAQVALCFDHARTDPAFDLARRCRRRKPGADRVRTGAGRPGARPARDRSR